VRIPSGVVVSRPQQIQKRWIETYIELGTRVVAGGMESYEKWLDGTGFC